MECHYCDEPAVDQCTRCGSYYGEAHGSRRWNDMCYQCGQKRESENEYQRAIGALIAVPSGGFVILFLLDSYRKGALSAALALYLPVLVFAALVCLIGFAIWISAR